MGGIESLRECEGGLVRGCEAGRGDEQEERKQHEECMSEDEECIMPLKIHRDISIVSTV